MWEGPHNYKEKKQQAGVRNRAGEYETPQPPVLKAALFLSVVYKILLQQAEHIFPLLICQIVFVCWLLPPLSG